MSHRIRLHPAVPRDLIRIAQWIAEHTDRDTAFRKLDKIEATIRSLALTPHRGSLRDEIAPGMRAIPSGRKAVIVFRVDDAKAEVLVYAVTYGGADWARLARTRR